jgi:hypothetical protein
MSLHLSQACTTSPLAVGCSDAKYKGSISRGFWSFAFYLSIQLDETVVKSIHPWIQINPVIV